MVLKATQGIFNSSRAVGLKSHSIVSTSSALCVECSNVWAHILYFFLSIFKKGFAGSGKKSRRARTRARARESAVVEGRGDGGSKRKIMKEKNKDGSRKEIVPGMFCVVFFCRLASLVPPVQQHAQCASKTHCRQTKKISNQATAA